MKEFKYNQIYRGIQLEVLFCAKTKKDAATLLDITPYLVNNWVFVIEPRTEECIKNPYKLFASFSHGELGVAFPKLKNKIMNLTELQNIIDDHRKVCGTYNDTLKHYK